MLFSSMRYSRAWMRRPSSHIAYHVGQQNRVDAACFHSDTKQPPQGEKRQKLKISMRQRYAPYRDESKYVVYEYEDADGDDAQGGDDLGKGIRTTKKWKTTLTDRSNRDSDVIVHMFPQLSKSKWTQQGTTLHTALLNIVTYLLPQDFPNSVSHPSSYLSYCKWQSLQYVLGSMGGVLSTQSLLYAVGVGSGSVPLAAALNWVIKDGLGQLGGVFFASRVATNFDGDPKMWRFRGEVAMIVSTMLEICTPLVPQFFLPLASLANIGKNVSFLTASATRAAINLSFCGDKGRNLGDVTAKSGSQAITSSLIGTGLGVAIAPLVGSSFVAVFSTFAIIASLHLYSLFRAMSAVRLSSLNMQRTELLIHEFLVTRHIMTPDEVSHRETFVKPYHSPFHGSSLIINPPVDEFVSSATELAVLKDVYEDRGYVLTVVSNHDAPVVAVWLMENADTACAITAMVHASMLRNEISESGMDGKRGHDSIPLSKVDDLSKELLQGMTTQEWQTDQDHIDSNSPKRVSFVAQ